MSLPRSGSKQLCGAAASRLAEVCLWLLRIGSKQLHRAASKWLASSGLPLRQSGAKQLSGAAAKWLAVACRCFDVARSSGAALLRSSKHWFVAASKWLEAAVWCCFGVASRPFLKPWPAEAMESRRKTCFSRETNFEIPFRGKKVFG